MEIETIIKKLELVEHPEGGFFRETYRSKSVIPGTALPNAFNSGERNYATMIYFLLHGANFSAFHKIRSDEGWHFYMGSPVRIVEITTAGLLKETVLHNDIANGATPQYMVPAGNWFASEVLGREGYALVGCTVSPGFDFQDFELADRAALIAEYPDYSELINRFTR